MTLVFARSLATLVLVACLLPLSSHAADAVALRYAVVTAQQEGPVVRGTLRVEVQNLTDGTLQNVDVRLANPGANSIDKGLFQIGSIPAGEARSVVGGFVFNASSPAPILWRVDYDDENGGHHQSVLPGIEVGQ